MIANIFYPDTGLLSDRTSSESDYLYNLYEILSNKKQDFCNEEGVKMADSVEERVKKIVVDLLGVDEDRVVPSADFRGDLEADSLDLVELIMAFEEQFGGEITDEDAQKIKTVGQAVEYIKTRM